MKCHLDITQVDLQRYLRLKKRLSNPGAESQIRLATNLKELMFSESYCGTLEVLSGRMSGEQPRT